VAEPLQLPVFAVDGWTGNARDDEAVEWWITKENGWSDGPDLRLTLPDRPQRDGAFDGRSYRAARVITLEGIAIAPDEDVKERAKDRLGGVLADGTRLAELSVGERSLTRRAMVRLSAGVKLVDVSPYTFEFSLQVTAPDPRRYSADEHVLDCGLPRRGAGLDFPLRLPFSFGEPVDGRITTTNAGTVDTAPLWTISGPCELPRIANTTTGEELTFDITLGIEEQLLVDADARTVRLAGGASRRNTLRPGSAWFTLPPGPTQIAFHAWTFNERARLSVSWRDAWY
jgi:Phage tail protein